MLSVTTEPIDVMAVTQAVRSRRAGAVVLFLGTVREITGSLRTTALTYEAYEAMAVASLKEITREASDRWPLEAAAVVHRTGRLEPGDIAVAVAVSSAHRCEAFEAGQWIMDTIKQHTPIWKKEMRGDGSAEWVHPDPGETAGAETSPDTAAGQGAEA